MIELKITGSDANEVYQQMLDLAKAPQFYFHPWEASQGATIEPDPIIACDQDVPAKQQEKKGQTAPSPQAERGPSPKMASEPTQATEPTISVGEMRKRAIAFGKSHGNPAMKKILDTLGVVQISELDEEGRAKAVAMMEDADHA